MPSHTFPRNWSPFGAESFIPSTVVVVVSVWPTFMESFEVRSLAHQIVIIDTPNRLAMPVRVSPSW